MALVLRIGYISYLRIGLQEVFVNLQIPVAHVGAWGIRRLPKRFFLIIATYRTSPRTGFYCGLTGPTLSAACNRFDRLAELREGIESCQEYPLVGRLFATDRHARGGRRTPGRWSGLIRPD